MFERFLQELDGPIASMGWEAALARLIAALLLGAAIGWEREIHSRPAGLRTHMLICVASCLFTILTLELMTLYPDAEQVRTDPIRIIEAVTAGVAFLAAGMIFTNKNTVHGLTTGAGMWLAGAVGVSCGIGRLSLALMATVLSVVILWLLGSVMGAVTNKNDRGGTAPD